MPDTDPAYRSRFRAAGDEIELREPGDDDDESIRIRMPIASTGVVRNEGDDPLTREEVDGMATQIAERRIGVFPAHGGDTMIASGRYSPFEKLGEWESADVESREAEDVLMATARMPDPETLPAATGAYREALAILKEQAKRGIGQDSSIGWRDDESFPGGVDLMEASIVGIGADWRTNTGDESAEVVARAAVDAGADPEALVERVQHAVERETDDMTDTDDPDSEQGTDTNTDEQDADTESDETTERGFEDRMLEMQEEQTELLRTLVEREDGMDDEEEDEDDDPDEENDADVGGESESDTESEQAPDPDADEEQAAEDDGVSERVAELEAELDELREGGLSSEDVDTPNTESEQDVDGGETTTPDAEAGRDFDNLGDYR